MKAYDTTPDPARPTEHLKTELRRLKWLFLLVPTLLMLFVFSKSPATTEFIYSRGIFVLINNVWGAISGILPFSIAEFLLYTIVPAVPAVLIVTLLWPALRRACAMRIIRHAVTLILAACVMFCSFYVLWGYNYYRQPIKALLELDVRARSVEELAELCFSLADAAKSVRENANEDENGVFSIDGSLKDLLRSIPDAYDALSLDIPFLDRPVSYPKQVLYSEGMSILGIAGIYIPFTAEANVNVHQPDMLIASSAAHESAHSIGFARENEANFLAYLACLKSEKADIRYSGLMLALIHCGNALHSADKDAYTALLTTYSDAMKRDLYSHNEYWEHYESPASENMNKLNDNYLKFNNQESGIKSYGEMVDLLLAWHETRLVDIRANT